MLPSFLDGTASSVAVVNTKPASGVHHGSAIIHHTCVIEYTCQGDPANWSRRLLFHCRIALWIGLHANIIVFWVESDLYWNLKTYLEGNWRRVATSECWVWHQVFNYPTLVDVWIVTQQRWRGSGMAWSVTFLGSIGWISSLWLLGVESDQLATTHCALLESG